MSGQEYEEPSKDSVPALSWVPTTQTPMESIFKAVEMIRNNVVPRSVMGVNEWLRRIRAQEEHHG